MDFRLVLTARVLSRKDIEDLQQQLGEGAEIATIPSNTEDDIITAAWNADAVITLMQPYTRKVMENLKKCKLIFCAGTGYESIDVAAATENGICIAYPGDYCMDEVAEHAVALLLASARKITRLDRAVREGKWADFEKREIRGKILPPVFRLKGKTLGLVGLGRIGRTIVPKAQGLGLKVIAYDPHLAPEIFTRTDVEPVTFETLLEKSDYISIQASFSPGSKHMFGLEQFQKMKSTAYIVNVGRGAFLDEEALYTALSRGYIAGAGLDVAWAEPECLPPGHPLLNLDNVIVTAHSAYYSEDAITAYRQRIYGAVVNIANGRWPDFFINPEVKENFQRKWQP